jgi:hypothetical protein
MKIRMVMRCDCGWSAAPVEIDPTNDDARVAASKIPGVISGHGLGAHPEATCVEIEVVIHAGPRRSDA